jgi:phenylalanyl-tRNA synthetase beta chain
MQFPESWLREFCNPPLSTTELAHLLTMAGLEVESLRPAAPPFTGVVVAEIVEAEQHPNADRLRVCKVDAGAHSAAGLLQIVCGAPNARVGIKVPLALVGAQLPPAEGQVPEAQAFEIKLGMLRGVQSEGMLCSARELKLSEDHGGLLELAPDAKPGADIREWLALDDTLFTLKLTPNLAHGLSVYGIAREVSALTGTPLKTPGIAPVVVRHDAKLPVRIEAPDLCGRFSGRIVSKVDTKAKTPAWMVDRLARCGQRSVTALVDISNYVMFEFGQPSHIFDLDKIHDHLVVRWAKAGETLKLLNGNTVELDAQVGVIADAGGVESLAGIMGGDATAVSDDTRNVYVEAAFWWPEAVAGRSRRFNFNTDAGHRFERGVDPARTVEQIERITGLIIAICGGEAGPVDDQQVNVPERAAVALRIDRAAKVIGMPVTQDQCAEVFTRLGLGFIQQPGRLLVTPPSWRFDLSIEVDLIEEVIRVIGYDQLPDTAPLAPVTPHIRLESQRSSFAVRHALAALDYQETISFSFVETRWEHELHGNADPIMVLNPIAAPLAAMRSSLIGSLIQVLRHNLARKTGRVRVFELGRVAMRDATVLAGDSTVAGIDQPMRVAGLAYGAAVPSQWGAAECDVDFYDVKGDVEALLAPLKPVFERVQHPALHPGRSARVIVDGISVGVLGELHPRWCQGYELPQAPVVFEFDLSAVLLRPVPAFKPIARHQSAWRDLALVVPETATHDGLINALRADPSGLVQSATLFDVYKPAEASTDVGVGERSMAVRLELLDTSATLTDDKIDAAVALALGRAAHAQGARLRG